MAFLRSPAGRATLSALLALFLLWGPLELTLTRPTLPQTLLALLVSAVTWGCAVRLIYSRSVSGRNVLLVLVVLTGATIMHAAEPFVGVGFQFFAAFAAPYRVRLRAAVPLTVLPLIVLPLVSYLTGLDMAAASGVTTGLAYSVVIAFLIWHVTTTKRQTAEVAEARAGEAVLQERARLAREVHDILAHAQSAQIVHLEGARLLLKSGGDPAQALDRVERAVSLARAGLEETRRALDALRGQDLPLPQRLERLAAEYRATTGAPCALTVEPGADDLSAEAKLAVARTAQEALTNVRKHAPGAPVTVSLRRRGDWCELKVRDDGTPDGRRSFAVVGAHGDGGASLMRGADDDAARGAIGGAGDDTVGGLVGGAVDDSARGLVGGAGGESARGLVGGVGGAGGESARRSVGGAGGDAARGLVGGAGGDAGRRLVGRMDDDVGRGFVGGTGGDASGDPVGGGNRDAASGPTAGANGEAASGPAAGAAHEHAAFGGGAGYGLIGMRERAELIGGSLEAGAEDGGGFAVVLRVPA